MSNDAGAPCVVKKIQTFEVVGLPRTESPRETQGCFSFRFCFCCGQAIKCPKCHISIKDFLGFFMNDFFWRVVQGCFLESPQKKQPSKVGPYHLEFVSYQKVCFDMLSLKTRKINLFMCKYRVYSIRIKSPRCHA